MTQPVLRGGGGFSHIASYFDCRGSCRAESTSGIFQSMLSYASGCGKVVKLASRFFWQCITCGNFWQSQWEFSKKLVSWIPYFRGDVRITTDIEFRLMDIHALNMRGNRLEALQLIQQLRLEYPDRLKQPCSSTMVMSAVHQIGEWVIQDLRDVAANRDRRNSLYDYQDLLQIKNELELFQRSHEVLQCILLNARVVELLINDIHATAEQYRGEKLEQMNRHLAGLQQLRSASLGDVLAAYELNLRNDLFWDSQED